MSDDLSEIRRGVGELHIALALHDQKVESNVAQVVSAQERMAAAVEKIGEATIAIHTLAEQWEKRNGKSGGLALNKNTFVWLLAILLLASASAGAGGEIVTLLFKALK